MRWTRLLTASLGRHVTAAWYSYEIDGRLGVWVIELSGPLKLNRKQLT
jgi:hypothetical protein